MARRSSRKSSAGSKSRATRSQSRKSSAPAVAEVEVVEEDRGLGLDDGLMILTAVLLLAGCLLLDYARASHYGEGLIF